LKPVGKLTGFIIWDGSKFDVLVDVVKVIYIFAKNIMILL